MDLATPDENYRKHSIKETQKIIDITRKLKLLFPKTKKPLIVRTGYDTYLFSIKENKKVWIVQFYKLLTYLALKFSDLYTVTSTSDKEFLDSKCNE